MHTKERKKPSNQLAADEKHEQIEQQTIFKKFSKYSRYKDLSIASREGKTEHLA